MYSWSVPEYYCVRIEDRKPGSWRHPVASVLAVTTVVFLSSIVRTNVYDVKDDLIQINAAVPAERLDDAKTSLAWADHLFWLNNGPRAAAFYARAQQLFARRGDKRGELEARIGLMRSRAETMSFVELSMFLNKQLQRPIVREDLKLRLRCLIAKGYTDIEIDYRAAKRDWIEAQEIAKQLGQDQWVIRASGELGLVAFMEGDARRAAMLLGGALLSTMANGDIGGQIRFLELLGTGFEEVNRDSEALNFFQRAIRLATSEEDSGFPFMAYEGEAQALLSLGRPDTAKSVLKDALLRATAGEKLGHQAHILMLLGKLAARTGQIGDAIEYLEDAAKAGMRMQFYSVVGDSMFELARLYRDIGNLSAAQDRAAKGLIASQRVGDRYFVPRDLTVLAELQARIGHLVEANALYQQAEDVITGMLMTVDEPYWRSSLSASMSETYLEHFDLARKQGDVENAFRILEQVRGRTLAWALKERQNFAKSESAQTIALENEISGLQIQLMRSNSSLDRDKVLDRLAECERRLGLAWAITKGPNKAVIVQPVSLQRMREDLKPDEILLEYVLDDPIAFCLAITHRNARLRVLPSGRKEIETLTHKYISELRAKGADIQLSRRLYESLIHAIPETARTTRIIVVPDGVLNLLPFEALRNEQDEYLVKEWSVGYAPSATILDMLRRRRKRSAPKPFLGVGDAAYQNQGGAGEKITSPNDFVTRIFRDVADLSGLSLYDLPHTRAEIVKISKIMGPQSVMLLGKSATETIFKKEPLDQFRVLHLAVHGFADRQFPERSALVLGSDSQSGDDGLLQVREILKLRLNADLTTLSGCDTGVGRLQGQEGISNLVQAFLVAGSRSVVASLWSADDTFADALMEKFYYALAQHEDLSSALRDAKLSLLRKYGDEISPFYWAAFVVVGETSTLVKIEQ
jgi:CHAT domain-containing protein